MLALLFPLAAAAGVLFFLAGTTGPLSFVFIGLILMFTLVFQLVIFGTQYCAFRDIFGLDEGSAGPGPAVGKDDQLLA